MEKTLVVIAALLSSVFLSKGQSLVVNGSFEKLHACPTSVGDINYADGWNNGGLTPDLFSTCTNGQENGLNVPDNYVGTREPLTGNCYAGLVLFTNHIGVAVKKNYLASESIWTKLRSPLLPRKKYQINIHVSTSDSSIFYSNYITAVFSQEPIGYKDTHEIVQVVLINVGNKSLSDKSWTILSTDFVPLKSYRYLTIGLTRTVFSVKEYKEALNRNSLGVRGKKYGDCYYYLDDISLFEIQANCLKK